MRFGGGGVLGKRPAGGAIAMKLKPQVLCMLNLFGKCPSWFSGNLCCGFDACIILNL